MATKITPALFRDPDRLLGDYDKLGESEENESLGDSENLPQPHRRFRNHCTGHGLYGLVTAALLSTVVILSFILISNKSSNLIHSNAIRPLEISETEELFSESYTCGSTPAEARSRGCIFDLMLAQWIHELCYDGETMNEWLLSGQYRYYHHKNQTHELPEEEVLRGEFTEIYATGGFHFRHCAYTVDMMARSFLTGGPIEVSLYRYEHTQHCINTTLTNGWDTYGNGNMSRLRMSFGVCGFPKR